MKKINSTILKNKILFSLVTICATFVCMTRVYSSDVLTEMQEREKEICNTNPIVINTKEFDDYKVTIYQVDDWLCQRLEIQRRGEVVYSKAEVDAHFFFGAKWDEDGQALMHLTGRNSPELVITNWTGGMHCCFSLLVFEVGSEFKKIAEIEGGNYYPFFEDVDGDGIQEVKVGDDFLAYVFSSFAFSAIAEVTLKYSSGRFEVSAAHMVKSPPDWDSLVKKIPRWQKEIRERENPDFPPQEFIQAITNLIFSGNKEIAMELVQRTWPVDIQGKDEFLASYEEALHSSQYYGAFEKQLNSSF